MCFVPHPEPGTGWGLPPSWGPWCCVRGPRPVLAAVAGWQPSPGGSAARHWWAGTCGVGQLPAGDGPLRGLVLSLCSGSLCRAAARAGRRLLPPATRPVARLRLPLSAFWVNLACCLRPARWGGGGGLGSTPACADPLSPHRVQPLRVQDPRLERADDEQQHELWLWLAPDKREEIPLCPVRLLHLPACHCCQHVGCRVVPLHPLGVCLGWDSSVQAGFAPRCCCS